MYALYELELASVEWSDLRWFGYCNVMRCTVVLCRPALASGQNWTEQNVGKQFQRSGHWSFLCYCGQFFLLHSNWSLSSFLLLVRSLSAILHEAKTGRLPEPTTYLQS